MSNTVILLLLNDTSNTVKIDKTSVTYTWMQLSMPSASKFSEAKAKDILVKETPIDAKNWQSRDQGVMTARDVIMTCFF